MEKKLIMKKYCSSDPIIFKETSKIYDSSH